MMGSAGTGQGAGTSICQPRDGPGPKPNKSNDFEVDNEVNQ